MIDERVVIGQVEDTLCTELPSAVHTKVSIIVKAYKDAMRHIQSDPDFKDDYLKPARRVYLMSVKQLEQSVDAGNRDVRIAWCAYQTAYRLCECIVDPPVIRQVGDQSQEATELNHWDISRAIAEEHQVYIHVCSDEVQWITERYNAYCTGSLTREELEEEYRLHAEVLVRNSQRMRLFILQQADTLCRLMRLFQDSPPPSRPQR